MLATPVTVVRHAPEDMGRIGAELAYARLEGDGGPPQRRTIPCELVAPRIRGGAVAEPASCCRPTASRASTSAARRSPRCAAPSPRATACPRTGSARRRPSSATTSSASAACPTAACCATPPRPTRSRFLGPHHAARRGPDPALLVKLLDAGERLPVHVHPDDAFARRHAAHPVRQDRGVDRHRHDEARRERRGRLPRGRRARDPRALGPRPGPRRAARRAQPAPGQRRRRDLRPRRARRTRSARACCIVELQQPTDLSILLEWDGFGIADEDEATLGLGWEVALSSASSCAHGPGAAARPRPDRATVRSAACSRPRPTPSSAPSGSPRRRSPRSSAASRSSSSPPARARCWPRAATRCRVRRGDTVLVPWEAGPCHLEGDVEAIACRPPADGGGPVSDLLLGIDVGTSACKAAVVDADGAERAHGQAPTPWQRSPPAPRSTPTRCSTRPSRPRRGARAPRPTARSAGSA